MLRTATGGWEEDEEDDENSVSEGAMNESSNSLDGLIFQLFSVPENRPYVVSLFSSVKKDYYIGADNLAYDQ